MTPENRHEDAIIIPPDNATIVNPTSSAVVAVSPTGNNDDDDANGLSVKQRQQHQQHQQSKSSGGLHNARMSTGTGMNASTPSRPSLLAISSARGSKASSTSSSTSITTIAASARSQRGVSNASHRTIQHQHEQHQHHHNIVNHNYEHTLASTAGGETSTSGGYSLQYEKASGEVTETAAQAHIEFDAIIPGPSTKTTSSIASISGSKGEHVDSDNDDVDDDDIDAELVSWPLEDELDPRTMLREQLRRSESAKRLPTSPLSKSSRNHPLNSEYKGKGKGKEIDDDAREARPGSIRSRTTSLRTGISGDTTISSPSSPSLKATRSTKVSDASTHATVRADNPNQEASLTAVEVERRQKGQRKIRPRRYFVLSSAGKPVFASQPNWRKRRKQYKQDASAGTAAAGGAADINEERRNNTEEEEEEEEEDSEEMLTSLVGVIQAIISLYAVENDMIRYVDAGDLRIAFYLKAPIYLVAVSDWGEPESVLRTHLEYLYLAIISITTQSSIATIFNQRSNYDLRRLLAGTENMLNHLLDNLQETGSDPDAVFEVVGAALRVVPFLASYGPYSPLKSVDSKGNDNSATRMDNAESLRDECTKALRPPKKYNGILYAVLVSHSSLVTLLRPKDHSIYPSDLHILLNTLSSTKALRAPNSESWIPICLPRFNSKGFLHAFISYFDDSNSEGEQNIPTDENGRQDVPDPLGLGVILITADKEGFFDMKTWKDSIVTKLLHKSSTTAGALANFSAPEVSLYMRLKRAIIGSQPDAALKPNNSESGSFDMNSFIPNIPPVRHFWYKSKTYVQIFTPYSNSRTSYGPDDTATSAGPHSSDGLSYPASIDDRRRLIGQYLNVHDALHNPLNRSRGDGPAKLVYMVGEHEAILGMSTAHYEVYLCLPPLTSKKYATDAVHALTRWIRRHERLIFLTSAPSF